MAVSAALHVAGAAALAAWPVHWPWIVAALVIDHAGLALGGLLPRSRLLGPNLRSIPPFGEGPGQVALTFDDGPEPSVTPKVLELLDDAGCSASFFFIGERARQHDDLVVETVRRGHKIENHTFSHPHAFAFYSPSRIALEIDRAQEQLNELAGRAPRFFRPPAGIRSPWLDPMLHRRGLSLASWTRRGFDTVERRPEVVAHRLLRRLAPGDVLMLHDGSCSRDRSNEPVVVEALKRVLEELNRRGLRGTSLPRSR